MYYIQTVFLKMLLFVFCSFYSISKISPPVQRDISEYLETWRHIATVVFNKQKDQILLSCVSSFTYGSSFTNPRPNFFFCKDLCIVISD